MMFALGIANLIVAATCDRQTWALYITIVPLGAKFTAFGLQYMIFRTIIIRRLRGERQPAVATA
jgi:hypothetical protein